MLESAKRAYSCARGIPWRSFFAHDLRERIRADHSQFHLATRASAKFEQPTKGCTVADGPKAKDRRFGKRR
jgi:hypothetical protein